tara:strand:- start:649 stop:936 length:288 start_codon:yes stop_codon:yes gene_type:complete
MSKVRRLMKEQGLKYFASISPKHKDKTTKAILMMRHDLYNLDHGLALAIINQSTSLKDLIEEKNLIDGQLQGQKCFNHEGTWFPFNLADILKLEL